MANNLLSRVQMLGPYPANYQMLTTLSAGTALTYQFNCVGGNSAPVAESKPTGGSDPVVRVWYSERLAANFTVEPSSVFSLAISAYWALANPNATLRLTLSKVTQGGSNIETLLGSVDGATAKDNVISKDTYTFVIPGTTVVAEGERFVLRMWAIPPSGGTFTTGELRYQFAASTIGNGQAVFNCPAGVTYTPGRTIVSLRRDASAVGGNFFDALSDTMPVQTATTGVVATANVSEKQWTRTSGGTALEWITPRFKDHWQWQATGLGTAVIFLGYFAESATSANASVRVKLFRWRAGVETECFTVDYFAELGTTTTLVALSDLVDGLSVNIVLTPTAFQIDDRLVIRVYAVPLGGSMPAGQTVTVWYDANTSTGRTYVQFNETLLFKAESDLPQEPENHITMTGVGN